MSTKIKNVRSFYEIIKKLKVLHEEYCGNDGIALEYAKGLYNWSFIQSKTEAEKSIAIIEELAKKYKMNTEITELYKKGKANFNNRI